MFRVLSMCTDVIKLKNETTKNIEKYDKAELEPQKQIFASFNKYK